MRKNTDDLFRSVFGYVPSVRCFAPGRVNLIGEHTDYNGGHVFPCALDIGIECSASKRSDGLLRFYSENFRELSVVEISVNRLEESGSWIDYPIGVIRAFKSFGYPIKYGADLAFCGDLPAGSGLSSSAALEVLTGAILRELFGFSVTAQELAVFGQFAENRFIGVNCGIMDQFASAMGKESCAILLDTDTLEYSYAPLPNDRVDLVIVNSGVKHSLAFSAYNERRRQCEKALADIRTVIDAKSLCGVSPEAFETVKTSVSDDICRKRAKHAVYEDHRTIAAFSALQDGRLEDFGRLMNESHFSLRDDYEVSCPELDFLAETAQGIKGVYGARMTGGGFGGCTINLVGKEYTQKFIKTIKAAYLQCFGKKPAVYIVNAGSGARKKN